MGIHQVLGIDFEYNDKIFLIVLFSEEDNEDNIKYFLSKLNERIIDVFIEVYKKIVNKQNKTYYYYINLFKIINSKFESS